MEKLVTKGLPLWVVLVGWVHGDVFAPGKGSMLWGREAHDDLTAQLAYSGLCAIESLGACDYLRDPLTRSMAAIDAIESGLSKSAERLHLQESFHRITEFHERESGNDDVRSIAEASVYATSGASRPGLVRSDSSVSSQGVENTSTLPRRTVGQSVREEYQTNGVRGALGQLGNSALLGLGNLTGQRQRGSRANWRGGPRRREESRARTRARTGELCPSDRPSVSRSGGYDLLSESAGPITIANPSPHVSGLSGVPSSSLQRPNVSSPPPPIGPRFMSSGEYSSPYIPDEDVRVPWSGTTQPSTSSEDPGDRHSKRGLLRKTARKVTKEVTKGVRQVAGWLGMGKSADSLELNGEQTQPRSLTPRNELPVHQGRIVNSPPNVPENRPTDALSPPTGSAGSHPLGNESLGLESSSPPPPMGTQTGSAQLSACILPPPPPPPPSNLLGSAQSSGQGGFVGQIPRVQRRPVNQGGRGAERGVSTDPRGALMEAIRRVIPIARDENGNPIQSGALLRQNPSNRSTRQVQVGEASGSTRSSLSGGGGDAVSLLVRACTTRRFRVADSSTSGETVESSHGDWTD